MIAAFSILISVLEAAYPHAYNFRNRYVPTGLEAILSTTERRCAGER